MVRTWTDRIGVARNQRIAAVIHYAVWAFYWPLSHLARLLRRPGSTSLSEPRRILLVRADGMGDLITSIPAFRGFRRRFPGAHITLLAAPAAREVVEPMPYFDEILQVEFPWMRTGGTWRDYVAWVRRIRGARFDLAVDLRGDFRVILFLYLCGIPRRLGLAAPCDFLLTEVVTPPEEVHSIDWGLALLQYLGIHDESPMPSLTLTADDWAFVDAVWREHGLKGVWPVVSIHPDVRYYGRKWENERYAQVADRLVERYGARVLLTGAPNEKECVEEVARLMRQRPVVLAGKTSIRQLAAVFARSDLFLGVDSGPLHLAAAAGPRVVGLFGLQDPRFLGPYGPNHCVVTRRQDFPCSSPLRTCTPQRCALPRQLSCMRALDIEEVWSAVEAQVARLMSARGARPATRRGV